MSESKDIVLPPINISQVKDTSKLIMTLVDKLSESLENYTLDENNIIDYVVRIMTLVETNKSLSGFEKKAVVIEVLTRLVDKSTRLSDESKTHIKTLSRVIVPGVIEGLVNASKGLLSINKKVEEVSKKLCCCFF